MAVFDILMIDDDEGNFHSLKNYAAARQVVMRYARTLEEGMQQLQENNRIMGIMLDGKGLVKKGEQESLARTAFVHEALTQIALLEAKREKVFPKLVLTAWYDNLKESLHGRVAVFDKKKLALDENMKQKMFEYLVTHSQDSKEYAVRHKYANELTWMDIPYLYPGSDNKLFTILYAMEKNIVEAHHFNIIRDLYESVLKGLGEKDPALLPPDLFHRDGRPNLDWTLRYLGGLPITDRNKSMVFEKNEKGARIPSHVHDCATFIKEITSAFSHTNPGSFSPYAFKATVFSLLEFLKWYTTYVDQLSFK